MPTLPTEIMTLLAYFAPLFSARTWGYVPALVAGSILTPKRRLVSTALRALGLARVPWFQNFHRVLNRAKWSPLAASRILLGLLIATFVPEGPLLVALDDTIERRRGAHIAAKGIYRDPVRSSRGHFVKASGLRWLCLMLLVPIPWVGRAWALPFLSALAPSERFRTARGMRHKTLLDWARQLVLLLRRWYPARDLVIVADSTYAALDFLARCSQAPIGATLITRLRLDAALYAPAPPPDPHRRGRPRLKGERLPTLAQVLADPSTDWTAILVARWYGGQPRLVEIASGTAAWYHSGKPPLPLRWVLIRDREGAFEPAALLCTDQDAAPAAILAWFVQRWQLEVTLEECRAHLGLETQRQWNDLAIARTTPWYAKAQPTFSDTLALVRRYLWTRTDFPLSPPTEDVPQIPPGLADHL